MLQSDALRIMLSGANVFLTGAPGAGKTYVLNQFIRQARAEGKKIAVTASTGIAATHLDGVTIHSFTGIGIKKEATAALKNNIKKRKGKTLNGIDVLVIDEVSMLSAVILDVVDTVLRSVRNNTQPFGGVQIVLCGDLFQLPPVRNGREINELSLPTLEEYQQYQADPFGFITNSLFWKREHFTICYLTEQHRQGEGAWLDVLTHIRNGQVTQQDCDLLEERLQCQPPHDDIMHLYPHNMNVDQENQRRLQELSGETRSYTAQCEGDEAVLERYIKSSITPELLILKEHARVMALWNDANGHYVNGSMGEVIDFEPNKSGDIVPIVHFDNGNILAMNPRERSIMDGETEVATFTQIPLCLAWAITVHKSQGMTLDSATMNLASTFSAGMGYVALSRVSSIENLYLQGLSNRVFAMNSEILALDNDLLERSIKAEEKLSRYGEEAFDDRPIELF